MVLSAILLVIVFVMGLFGGAVMCNELWLAKYPNDEKVPTHTDKTYIS